MSSADEPERESEVALSVLAHPSASSAESLRFGAEFARTVAMRTSVDIAPTPRVVRLDDETLFETPFLYWRVTAPRAPSEGDLVRLARFVERGGMVLVEDVSEGQSFERALRRGLAGAFAHGALRPVAESETLLHSYYLLAGTGIPSLEGLRVRGRLALVYVRHDVAGSSSAVSGRASELASRLLVNVLLYGLCLDYKDDQVHAPFIMRRRGVVP